MSTRANEPAYPCEIATRYYGGPLDGETNVGHVGGLTIRECFAAQFLAAMLTHPTRSTDGLHECEIACQYADALLAELSKEKPHG